MVYAPDALRELANGWREAIGSAVFSGIVSSRVPPYGYHYAANQLPVGDYSRQLPADRIGIDPDAASALDISQSPNDMKLVTRRFHDSWRDQNDPRLNNVREVIGTLDGRTVVYMDCQSGQLGSADASHLWHIHVGVLRRYANDPGTMWAILSIVQGLSYAEYLGNGGEDMSSTDFANFQLKPGFGVENATIIGKPPLGDASQWWKEGFADLIVDFGKVKVRVAVHQAGIGWRGIDGGDILSYVVDANDDQAPFPNRLPDPRGKISLVREEIEGYEPPEGMSADAIPAAFFWELRSK